MKTYIVTRQAAAVDGWNQKAYCAESYSVDEDRQLHLLIGDSRIASFGKGCWIGIEEKKEDRCTPKCG